jgi:hypothetical protein
MEVSDTKRKATRTLRASSKRVKIESSAIGKLGSGYLIAILPDANRQ